MRLAGYASSSIFVLTTLHAFRLAAQADRPDGPAPPASGARHPMPASDEAELARTARLDTILRVALDRNRDVAENQARARAAEARRQAASRLPDLEAKYEQWGVPFRRPYALDQANTLIHVSNAVYSIPQLKLAQEALIADVALVAATALMPGQQGAVRRRGRRDVCQPPAVTGRETAHGSS